jgi:signal transduction histidine kinase
VAPYGDPGDDWLKLDEDRGRRLVNTPSDLGRLARGVTRPMLFLPGNNQLFGRVHISRKTNPNVRQTLDREGVIETDGFRELRQFVRSGIDYLTVAYAREYEAKRKAAKEQREDDAAALIMRARHHFVVASASMAPEQRSQVLQAIDLARDAVAAQQEEFISELSMLRVLASTGTMLVVFEHQLLGTLNGLRESHRALGGMLKRLPRDAQGRFDAELARLDTWISSARHQGELLGLLIARKARSRRRRLVVRPTVDAMKRAFESYTEDQAISFENAVSPSLKTPPMFEAELSAILVNLLTNAFKAVRERPTRRVVVESVPRAGQIVMRVSDTGIGAARARWEEFFQPFVGESEPDPILGEGTGLGLKIVRDFVGIYGGSARFVDPQPPWRTTVEVSLPEAWR